MGLANNLSDCLTPLATNCKEPASDTFLGIKGISVKTESDRGYPECYSQTRIPISGEQCSLAERARPSGSTILGLKTGKSPTSQDCWEGEVPPLWSICQRLTQTRAMFTEVHFLLCFPAFSAWLFWSNGRPTVGKSRQPSTSILIIF